MVLERAAVAVYTSSELLGVNVSSGRAGFACQDLHLTSAHHPGHVPGQQRKDGSSITCSEKRFGSTAGG